MCKQNKTNHTKRNINKYIHYNFKFRNQKKGKILFNIMRKKNYFKLKYSFHI